ncbi:uncharacterized protein [Rutidosis leptorrhynchoides]|uniref:uncharacterized protein n=1 Tax=Rutidosis leptorrhynchoides TaxID=125765 RepID=UPI003A99C797
MLDQKLLDSQPNIDETMRNKLLPKKICIYKWRVMLRRIPVRTELDKRGMDLESLRCPVCDNGIETVEHILLECNFAKDLWDRVARWWNMSISNHLPLEDRFKGLSHVNTPHAYTISSFRQAIEWVCGYSIWQNRNQVVFRKKKGTGPTILSEIQTRSFEWLSTRSKKIKIDWNQWLLNPNSYHDHG